MSEFKTPIKQRVPIASENLTIPASPFLNKLGYGTGVSVVQLLRSPRGGQIRSPWALKMLNKRVKPNRVYSERIQAEAELLQQMSHPNIVGFRAFSGGKILYLGMEACDLSLGDMIEKRVEEGDGEPFTPRQMLQVALDIGNGLHYLHFNMRILHGDIKSYNILVNGDFVICKLCDFGVTLPLDENGVFDKKAGKAVYFGTEAWSAPEVIHGGEITHKTDIWPLGLTLWEMVALMPPHAHCDDDSLDMSGDSTFSDMDYFSERYGTRPPLPPLPALAAAAAYRAPLALHAAATEPAAAARPAAGHLAAAARDMLGEL